MFARVIFPALLGAFVIATPALAGTQSDGNATTGSQSAGTSSAGAQVATAQPVVQGCRPLEQQFDTAIKIRGEAPKADEARKLRAEGGRLCASYGRIEDGIQDLEHALKDIDVLPAI